MNDTLMDQCRRDAEAIYYTMPWEKEEDRQLFEELNSMAIREQMAYAAALYHERSKRPPTVQGPPMKHRDMMEAWTEATAKHRTT